MRRILITAALVCSLAPLWFAVTRTQAAFHSFRVQYLDRGAEAAPTPNVDLRAFKPIPHYAGVPVLVYHGINDEHDGYSVTQQTFADQMAMLHAAGFHTLSLATYRRAIMGLPVRLPPRPILITFDDGRLDSFRGADAVLERYGYRATMFVVAGFASSHFYLQWGEIASMAKSGRWDIQEHAGREHETIPYRANGAVAPAYAVREQLSAEERESFAQYRARVTADLRWGEQQIKEHVPGYRPLAFAVPYSDFGQDTTNDPRIAPFLDHFLVEHFGLVFVESDDPVFSSPDSPRGAIGRIEIHTKTTAARLYHRLVRLDPASSALGRESMYASINEGTLPEADAMLHNVWTERGYPPLKLPWPLSWTEKQDDPHNDAYWRFQFYSLQPTSNLLWAYETTRDTRYLDRLLEILRSYTAYDRTRSYDRLTFDNAHQAAYRAMVLVNTQKKLSAAHALPAGLNDALLRSIHKLGAALARSDRDHWEWWVNHGFNEAAALLLVSDTYYHQFPEAWRWRDVAIKRLLFMVRTNIDRNGVDIENSPYYHLYVLGLVSQIAQWARTNSEPKVARAYTTAERKMLRYAAAVVQPDGRLPSLGASGPIYVPAMDTRVFQPLTERNPQFGFIYSNGVVGSAPRAGVTAFPASGFAVLRSRLRSELQRREQTFVTFDSGPYRTAHSDLDAESITLYAHGHELLPDSGLYTYLASPERWYFHGTTAHNTVVVDGRNQRAGIATLAGTGKNYAVGRSDLYPGVAHRRTVAVLRQGLVLVTDHLSSHTRHTYAQTWHVMPAAKLASATPKTASIAAPGTTLRIVQAHPKGLRFRSLRGTRHPMGGWFSPSYGSKVPNLQLSFSRTARSTSFVTVLSTLRGVSVAVRGNAIDVCASHDGYAVALHGTHLGVSRRSC